MKKIFKWIGMALLAILLVGIIALGGPVAWEVATGFGSEELTNTTYTGKDGTQLHGYLATPDGEGPHPAVLLIHEWWGLSEDITEIADQLAEEGYVVFAADAYRGQLTEAVPRALYLRINTPQEEIDSDLDDALAYLRSLPNVDASSVATWGFCFGGTQSMYLGTRHDDLAAVVTYYGSSPIQNADELGVMTAPVLGIWGANDQQIPLEEVNGFHSALDERGIENEVTIYSDVGHAFLDSSNLNDPDHPASQAWQQTLAFLDRNLR